MQTISYALFFVLIGSSMSPLFIHFFSKMKTECDRAKLASYLMSISLISSILLLFISIKGYIFFLSLDSFSLHLTTLNTLLCTLIVFVSFIVHRFSIRYMAGDRFYNQYFFNLSAVTVSAMFWVLVDNVFLLWIGWVLSQVFLIRLMAHKKQWEAAQYSGWLTLKTLMPGAFCLLFAVFLLYSLNKSTSMEVLLNDHHENVWALYLSLGLILIAAMMQSALWPFHRWLISSLNSPTPVSALMHAGLVNGGGILIVKFAPLFFTHETLLMILFLLGAISTFMGSIWKLIQSDVKRMLACSTMAQMGFMMMQCALGLFSAAITHLCWHGLFKAYLFLNSGSTLSQTKFQNHLNKHRISSILFALLGGLLAMYSFAYITNKPIFSSESTTFLLVFAFLSGAQITITILSYISGYKYFPLALLVPLCSGALYGASVYLIESIIPHLASFQAPQLNILHWITLGFFITIWFMFNFGLLNQIKESKLWCRFYMMMLNQSQPHPKTMTAIRSTYQF